jgi:hypothetical protein
MPPPDASGFDVDEARELVAARVRLYSLRDVAAEVGMSHSGLHRFLQGASPQAGTRGKLEAWCHQQRHGPSRVADRMAAGLVVRTLLEQVPASRRRAALRRLAEELARLGATPSEALPALRAAVQAESERLEAEG